MLLCSSDQGCILKCYQILYENAACSSISLWHSQSVKETANSTMGVLSMWTGLPPTNIESMTTVHLITFVCNGVVYICVQRCCRHCSKSALGRQQQWYRVKHSCCINRKSVPDMIASYKNIKQSQAMHGHKTNQGASMKTHHNNRSSFTSNESSSPQTSALK